MVKRERDMTKGNISSKTDHSNKKSQSKQQLPSNTQRSSALTGARALVSTRFADPDDGILESDSEEDEFENHGSKFGGHGPYDDEEEDEDEDEEDEEGDFEDEEDEERANGVGQWQPDEWGADGDEDDYSDEDNSDDEDEDNADLRSLQRDLKSLPLSTLAKAQHVLASSASSTAQAGSSQHGVGVDKAQKLTDMRTRLAEIQRAKGKAKAVVLSGQEEENNYQGETWQGRGLEKGSNEDREEEKEKKERAKRENKHAPTVMGTKRQVSRMRQVIDVKKPERRDPRFSSLAAGQINQDLHSKSYDFLLSMLQDEFTSLRSSLSAAQKAEKTCRLVDKPHFTAERERIELDLARVRTRLEKSKRESREREVLAKAKREEREKRAEGKGAWYMKKSEKQDLLLKARFDELEATGGKRAVKKAMDKKRKKVAAKEKKSRPFAPGGGGGGQGGQGFKRRRV